MSRFPALQERFGFLPDANVDGWLLSSLRPRPRRSAHKDPPPLGRPGIFELFRLRLNRCTGVL